MNDSLPEGILNAIDQNEGYWLPVGFENEPLNTALHRAVRYLISINAIKPVPARPGVSFQKWTRTQPN